LALEAPFRPPEAAELAVVICGSFRRGLATLREDRRLLADAGCEVLSPKDLDFVREEDGFVVAAHEQDDSPEEIEARHLASIRAADFVWLHAPDGYLGPSGAFELGTAAAAGVPVFARNSPRDVGLRHFVRVTRSPAEAAAATRNAYIADPGAGIRALQTYYARMAEARGWTDETPIESIVLLTEEVGELARAVREHVGLARRRGTQPTDAAEELADVQLYVVHLANVLGIDLASAVTQKEDANARRFAPIAAAPSA
jgi:NTP pyrophosphatase (non-canonical NTP hydrolase)/nucleoside 2-deoxyribosyltransferase